MRSWVPSKTAVSAVVAACLLAVLAGPVAAENDADRRAAQRAAAEIADTQARANEAAQAFAVAETQYDTLSVELQQLEAELAGSQARVDGLKAGAADVALRSYMRPDVEALPFTASVGDANEQMSARALIGFVAHGSTEAFDQYVAATQDLAARQQQVSDKRAATATAVAELDRTRAELQQRIDDLQQAEAQRQAAVREREAREAAARAAAEARRQAEAEARRQAEAEARRQAAAEAERQAEVEAQRQADAAKAQREAQAAAGRQAQEEAQRQADQAAHRTQEEAQRQADEISAASASGTTAATEPPTTAKPAPPAPPRTDPPTPALRDNANSNSNAGSGGGSSGGGGGGGKVCPVAGASTFTDTWGAPRSGGRSHKGVDMLGRRGTPLVAVVSGTVRQSTSGLGGNQVWLKGDDGNTYFYAHLDSYAGGGGHVGAGDTVGYMGDTGNARGTVHLHFEYHPGGGDAVNPTPFVANLC